MKYQDMTDEQRERAREISREHNRRKRLRDAIKAANEEADREKRFRPRPDAFGRTEDDIARTFTREALYGEQQTARYRGTGFYAGRRA